MPSPAHAQRSLQRATTRPPLHAPSSSAEPPAPVLVAPTVKRRLAHVKGPDNLTDHPPGRMHRVCFAMLRHDLLRPISGSLHLRESPGANRGLSKRSWRLVDDSGGGAIACLERDVSIRDVLRDPRIHGPESPSRTTHRQHAHPGYPSSRLPACSLGGGEELEEGSLIASIATRGTDCP